jgi:hypothetical protein
MRMTKASKHWSLSSEFNSSMIQIYLCSSPQGIHIWAGLDPAHHLSIAMRAHGLYDAIIFYI